MEPTPEQETPDTSYVTGIADGNLTTPVRLRDYLAGVGVVFRLPKRDRKKEAREAAAAARKRPAIRLPVRLILAAVAPLAIGVIGYQVYQRYFLSVPLPAEVIGTWATEDGRYAGRNFWLNQQSVAFQNGDKSDQFAVYDVKRVTRRESADTLFLQVDYDQGGHVATLSLAYLATPAPEVRLVNQPSIRWRRSGLPPSAR